MSPKFEIVGAGKLSKNLRSQGWRSRSDTGAQPSAYEAKLHAKAERPQSVIVGRTPKGCRKERFLERLPAPDQTPESAGYVYQFAEKVSRQSYS
ncbi:hypothetical protein MspRI1_12730 [Marinobacter sp. RI1]